MKARSLLVNRLPSLLSRPVIAAVVMVVWLFETAARQGFRSNTQGFVLSESQRLLQGQVPHRDFMSAKPVGSGLLHVIDWWLPLPVVLASRLTTVVELVAYSFLFVALIINKPVKQWSWLETIGAAVSVLINMHFFALGPWHTIDGLFVIAIGLTFVKTGAVRNNLWLYVIGFIVSGCAVVIKQSYAPSLLLCLFTGFHYRPVKPTVRHIVGSTCVYLIPLVGYFLIIALLGGASAFVEQSGGVPFPSLWTSVHQAFGKPLWSIVLLVSVVLLGVIELVRRTGNVSRVTVGATYLVALVGLLGPVALVSADIAWGVRYASLLLVAALILMWRDRSVLFPTAVALGAGLMAAISYGYAYPNLVGGFIAFTFVWLLLRDVSLPHFSIDRIYAPVLAVFTVGALFVAVQLTPEQNLWTLKHPGQVDLGKAIPAAKGIWVDPVTEQRDADIAKCVNAHPEYYQAVLPFNPGENALLKLNNPFPVDMMNNIETGDRQAQLLKVAKELNDVPYLVLLDKSALAQPENKNDLLSASPAFYQLQTLLSGERVTRIDCGGYVGLLGEGAPCIGFGPACQDIPKSPRLKH